MDHMNIADKSPKICDEWTSTENGTNLQNISMEQKKNEIQR